MNRLWRYTGIGLIPLVPLGVAAFFTGDTTVEGALGLTFAVVFLAGAGAAAFLIVDKVARAVFRKMGMQQGPNS